MRRSWYELPVRHAPLPHLTYSEHLPGRPWRLEIEGVVAAKKGNLVTVVLSDETQVLGRYPRAIRPVYGPVVHPAKTFTPVPCYEPFPRVVCYDAAEATRVGDFVHALKIEGRFYVKAGEQTGDGRVTPAVRLPAFQQIFYEIDKIVIVNWETRSREASRGAPMPNARVKGQGMVNRNPPPQEMETSMVTRKLLYLNRKEVPTIFDGARTVTGLNVHESGSASMSAFQQNRFDNPTTAVSASLRKLVGPDIDTADPILGEALLAKTSVDILTDADVLAP